MSTPTLKYRKAAAAVGGRVALVGSAVGGLFAFAIPGHGPYSGFSAQAVQQAAWNRVGSAMRGAMEAQREELPAPAKRGGKG
jgi:hypothetical protein